MELNKEEFHKESIEGNAEESAPTIQSHKVLLSDPIIKEILTNDKRIFSGLISLWIICF